MVTGGAGFIGSHLARRLHDEGWEVDIIDNLSSGFLENIPAGAAFYNLDLGSESLAEKLPDKKYDALFHFAAQSSGEVSFDDPVYDLKTNTLSTLQLLDWSLKKGTSRFIYASSMSVYGDQERQPVSESAMPRPKSFYGVGKLASECYLNIYQNLGVNGTALRFFNVYGPGQNLKNLRQGMVSIYLAYFLGGGPVVVKGSPERYRDFIYIDDVIDACLCCLDKPATFGRVFNVASGERTTVGELLRHIQGALPFANARIEFHPGTPGDTFGIVADCAAIKEATGWSAKVSLQDGLKRMCEWALGQ